MRKRGISISVLLLVGCEAELTEQGKFVREITTAVATDCSFLGPVEGREGFALSVAGDAASALNKVRNAVAEAGGNAFVINNTVSSYDSSIVQAEAYRC